MCFTHKYSPSYSEKVIIHPENFGYEASTVSLVDNLQKTFEQNLNHPDNEFELLNAIGLRIVIARNNKNPMVLSEMEQKEC